MKRARLVTVSAATLTALTLTLSGCATANDKKPAPEAATQEVAWPRTIDIPAGAGGEASTLTIEAEPKRIAALDYESAEVIAELGLADHLVLIPEAVLNPALGGHVEELEKVESTFPVAMEIQAENVIALNPDLVVMSPRHGNEAPIADVLQQAGISALQLPDSWSSSKALITNIDLIGQATGGDEQADTLQTEIKEGLKNEAAESTDDGPRVMVLTNQAGRPFVTAGSAYPIELLGLSGAQNVAAELGIDRTGPISAEQLVQANPDGIVLIDMNGTGDRMFTELLANPAVASLSAISNEKVLRVEGRQVQALGLTATVDGLSQLTDWVSTL
ncbi:ABC transporter substrate-binding protein [Leucobacter sp. UT-8R-CII-1-4]|uniref:ABC transporter substrate-binding protein n=1 Tax=Leucobacter sp. UT-8R-CII-1-4 TaxID=3040075 RepID=UPI0024A8464E|nr:ABC transporter substrate-binding protein [Leucobacter sp. UT-8R-CII-1-4]MDI6023452.1 ABC transporter substrate-binding protein [Leucobacter sp. UT-8R-CII-1-4]